MLLGFLLATAALGVQSEEEQAYQKLSACLAEHYPEMDAAARTQTARGYARAALASRAFGHDPQMVVASVEFKLSEGLEPLRVLARHSAALGAGLEKWIPDGPSRMKFPEDMLRTATAAQLETVNEFLGETLARPASTEQEKQALREQIQGVRETIVEALRSRISGPFREGVIAHAVDRIVKDQTGPELGDPVAGALTRPLKAEELAALKESIRQEAARAAAVEAALPEDRKFAETGEEGQDSDTPAIRLAFALSNRIYGFGNYNYPRTNRAYAVRDELLRRAFAWVREAYEPIQKELDRQKVEFRPPAFLDPPKPPTGDRAPSASDPSHKSPAGSSPSAVRPPSSPPPPTGPSSNRRWISALLLVLVAAAIVYGGWRRKRRVTSGA